MSSDDEREMKTKPRVVVAFGVFDLLHPGHVAFLNEARRHGDRLVVVVTRDERAEIEKGRRPYFCLEERIDMLTALSCVDEAIAGDRMGEWTMIERIRPDVICVGHDQDSCRPKADEQIARLASRPDIVRIQAFNRERYSTSAIRSQVGS